MRHTSPFISVHGLDVRSKFFLTAGKEGAREFCPEMPLQGIFYTTSPCCLLLYVKKISASIQRCHKDFDDGKRVAVYLLLSLLVDYLSVLSLDISSRVRASHLHPLVFSHSRQIDHPFTNRPRLNTS